MLLDVDDHAPSCRTAITSYPLPQAIKIKIQVRGPTIQIPNQEKKTKICSCYIPNEDIFGFILFEYSADDLYGRW